MDPKPPLAADSPAATRPACGPFRVRCCSILLMLPMLDLGLCNIAQPNRHEEIYMRLSETRSQSCCRRRESLPAQGVRKQTRYE